MKYKHKLTIGDSLDIAYPVHGRIKTEEAQLEMAEVYRKAEAFDQIIEISEECDNYMDFGDEIDAVVRSYKEDK